MNVQNSIYLIPLIAFKYLLSSSLTFGASNTSPIIFGTIIAKIIASENPITEPKLIDAPTITNKQNKTL